MNHKLDHKSGRDVNTIANVDTIEGIARVGTISEYLALSESGFGLKLGQAGTIQKWIGVRMEQSWHYPKGGSGPKFGKASNIANVGIIQRWSWPKLATVDII